MNKSDEKQFAAALNGLANLHGRQLTADSMAIYFRALEKYTWAEVSAAMAAHERDPQEGRFFPLPAHIIGHLRARNKRPSADEMWAIVPLREQDSAFWTQEAKDAFFQAALPLLAVGDKIAARMAFKAAYDRLCEDSDDNEWPIVWEFSPGWDETDRERVLRQALDRGLIEPAEVMRLLPTFELPKEYSKRLTEFVGQATKHLKGGE
jgi:hypothetical protein